MLNDTLKLTFFTLNPLKAATKEFKRGGEKHVQKLLHHVQGRHAGMSTRGSHK